MKSIIKFTNNRKFELKDYIFHLFEQVSAETKPQKKLTIN